ncbi:S8 family peptidase [Cellulosilyticum sp. I15G10I2]|uniref:S8 family peptidase n=1 Tax=Cellulosilyticum sp. I15G10I2 TaxID=1892843 RepID=UPI00085C5AA1|nr:S8 family peptidase [Cellulosilyticum sp. I15G10I2]
MTVESRQDNSLMIRDYILQSLLPVEFFRAAYPALLFEILGGAIVSVEVPLGAEEAFTSLRNAGFFLTPATLYGLYAREALVSANILMFHDYPFGPLRGNGVIIGFVDTGIEYTNTLFRNADGTTRILSIWDQTIPGSPPVGYTYGTTYSQQMINTALGSENPLEIVPTQDNIGHGTFLAGVAAGDDRMGVSAYRGGAPNAHIIMVKLRPAKVYLNQYYLIRDTDVAYQDSDVIAGINYLLEEALVSGLPLVICIGIGDTVGAHTGSTIVERYLDTISILRNVIVVVAAGNEGNTGGHFSSDILQGQRQEIEINVSAEEERGLLAFVWAKIPDKLAVGIRSPIGQVIERVPVIPNETTTYTFGLERTVITITYNYPDIQTGFQNVIIRFQNPTPGLWTIEVYADLIVNGNYNIWLQRRDFIIDTTRFLRADTLTTIAIPSSAEYVVTVGAYDFLDQSMYVGSGRGPTADNKVKPDIIAPGVNVRGPLVGGGYTTYTGTSIAAAITASAAALLMQWAVINGNLQNMNTRIARGIFIRGALRRRGIQYPNPIEGYGRLDLRNSIDSI